MNEFIYYLAGAVAVIFVFAPHEFAHAFAADKCGDATPRAYGRLTLNPIKHLDPYGFALCILTGFGWAKPVPINPYNFKKYRSGLFWTSVAGVIANYIVAFAAYIIFALLTRFVYNPNYAVINGNQALNYLVSFILLVFNLTYIYSLSVFVFNLLPFYPLDGFRVVEALTREINPVRRFLKNYGRYLLIFLILESFLCDVLVNYAGIDFAMYFDVLGYVQWFAQNILGWPIQALGGLILRI